VAPPTDGSRRRRWVAGGIAAAIVLLLCLGGAGGLAALVVLSGRVISDEAQTAVENYLTALKEGQFDHAYDLQCVSERARLSRSEFVAEQSDQTRISTFAVTGLQQRTDDVLVSTRITFVDATTQTVRYRTVQESGTTTMDVCGEG
jgi:hypothetical protein